MEGDGGGIEDDWGGIGKMRKGDEHKGHLAVHAPVCWTWWHCDDVRCGEVQLVLFGLVWFGGDEADDVDDIYGDRDLQTRRQVDYCGCTLYMCG